MSAPLPTVGERPPETVIGPFDAAALQRYADVSGDDNPLHLDDALAQLIGLAAPPVHGMKLLASFEPMLAAWRPDLAIVTLAATFAQPVLRGELVRLSGRVVRISEEGVLLRLMAHGAARAPALVGEALLRPASKGETA